MVLVGDPLHVFCLVFLLVGEKQRLDLGGAKGAGE